MYGDWEYKVLVPKSGTREQPQLVDVRTGQPVELDHIFGKKGTTHAIQLVGEEGLLGGFDICGDDPTDCPDNISLSGQLDNLAVRDGYGEVGFASNFEADFSGRIYQLGEGYVCGSGVLTTQPSSDMEPHHL